MSMLNIARFLKANNSINGLDDGMREYALPRQSGGVQYTPWQQSTLETEFENLNALHRVRSGLYRAPRGFILF